MSEQDAKSVGDAIPIHQTDWKFSGKAVEQFSRHVRRSIPMYDVGHDLICKLSDFFVKEDSVCYEIGTSLGELLGKLVRHHSHKPDVTWYGLDREAEMIQAAQEKLVGHAHVFLETADAIGYPFEKSDLIISYYCIQFIHPKYRQQLISAIYEALEWSGAFIWFEKVRGPDARFQDLLTSLYIDYKLDQNYSADEIIAKSQSLKNVLEPFSTQGNLDLLKRAGFVDIMPIMKYICFEGYLAIK